jgi:hypothetical protein
LVITVDLLTTTTLVINSVILHRLKNIKIFDTLEKITGVIMLKIDLKSPKYFKVHEYSPEITMISLYI